MLPALGNRQGDSGESAVTLCNRVLQTSSVSAAC